MCSSDLTDVSRVSCPCPLPPPRHSFPTSPSRSFRFHAGVTSHAKEVHKGARVELAPQVLAAANPTKPVARVTCTALVVATGARCECDFGLVDGRCRKHADVSRFHTFVPGAEVPMFPCLGGHVRLAAFHTQVLGVR